MKADSKKEFLSAYELFSDALFRYCYFKIHDREKALDMVQDVFFKAWRYVQNGNEIKNYKAFLYRLASNTVIDMYRKKETSSLDDLSDQGFEPEDTRADTTLFAEYEHALSILEKLPQEERDIVYMRLVQDLSPKEIGDILGKKENNISVKLHGAIQRMQKLIRPTKH